MSQELSVVLSLQTANALAKLDNFISQATSGLKNLASGFVGIGSVAGLTLLAKDSLEFANNLEHVRQITGQTSGDMAGLSLAAQKEGLDLSQVTLGLRTFSKYLLESGRDSKDLIGSLIEQADRFRQLGDGAAKNALAVKEFGRAGLQMIPFLNLGSQGLREIFERGKMLSGINDDLTHSAHEFEGSLLELKFASQGLALSFMSELLPALSAILKSTATSIAQFREWWKNSEAFRISLQSLVALFVTLAGIKIVSAGAGIFSFFIGAGAITSLTDFIAALQLLPSVIAAAVASMAVFVLEIAAVTAALLIGIKALEAWRAHTTELQSDTDLQEQNIKFKKYLLDRLKMLEESGKIEAGAAQKIRADIAKASTNADPGSAMYGLGRAASSIRAIQGSNPDEFQWTEEQLKIASEILNVEIAGKKLLQEKDELAFKETGYLLFKQVQLKEIDAQQDLEIEKHSNEIKAAEQGAISQKQFDELHLKFSQKLFSFEKERLAVVQAIRDEKIKEIDADYRLSNVEKFEKKKELATTPIEKLKLGADPNDFSAQFSVGLVSIKNSLGTFAQDVGKLLLSPIEGFRKGFESAFDKMLLTGRFNFASLAISIGTEMRQAFSKLVANMITDWILGKIRMLAISVGFMSADVGVHAVGETSKTSISTLHSAKRGLIRLGESLFHALQVAFRVTIHTLGEIAMTAVSITQQAIRLPLILAETIAHIIKAAAKAMSAVADIPFIGPVLAIGALAAVLAAGYGALSKREFGGDVRAGQPYIVGEKRPELFIPKQDGYILPSVPSPSTAVAFNQQSGGGGSPVHINVHNWNDSAAMTRHIRDNSEVHHIILDKVKRNAHVIGARI